MRVAVLLLALSVTACSQRSPVPGTFEEVAAASGLDFVQVSGAGGEFYLPEITGSGVGLIDYDGDGDLDVFFAQGAPLVAGDQPLPGNRLYRNELMADGSLRFTDVSEAAGALGTGFSVGVAVADIDDDGDEDLYVSGVVADWLLRNDGGRFTNVTSGSDLQDPRWNASASFSDVDGDRDLDLFVTAYVAEPVSANQACHTIADVRQYCSPKNFAALADRLYANDGAGRFKDVSTPSGIAEATGAGLGVVAADFNADGAPDFYVANDQTPNHLWINDGNGHFSDNALVAGAAYNANGMAEASMGLTVADHDGDGDEDLFMTHLNNESNTLYRNDGSGQFDDATDRVRLGAKSLPFTGWGARWFDADHDGDLDLFIANGAVSRQEHAEGDPYGQTDQLWLNASGRYAPQAGHLPATPAENSRGAAFGDIDNDGDIDVVVTTIGGPARLYLNKTDSTVNWIAVRLRQRGANREAIGARVAALVDGAAPQWRRVGRNGSFASSSDVRVHFGLGDASMVAVGIVWPDGQRERFDALPINHHVSLDKGDGRPWP